MGRSDVALQETQVLSVVSPHLTVACVLTQPEERPVEWVSLL